MKKRKGEVWIALIILAAIGLAFPPLGMLLLAFGIVIGFWCLLMFIVGGGFLAWLGSREEGKE